MRFRGAMPPWPYVGMGGGLPRCAYPGLWGTPFWYCPISSEQELDFLRRQAEVIRQELACIEERIQELEKAK